MASLFLNLPGNDRARSHDLHKKWEENRKNREETIKPLLYFSSQREMPFATSSLAA